MFKIALILVFIAAISTKTLSYESKSGVYSIIFAPKNFKQGMVKIFNEGFEDLANSEVMQKMQAKLVPGSDVDLGTQAERK